MGGWAVEDDYGGILLCGNPYSEDGDIINSNGGMDYWLTGLDSNGNMTLNKCYGTTNNDAVHAMYKATDGSIWMFGNEAAGAWLLHTDGTGNILNEKRFSASEARYGTMLLPLQNGFVLAGGYYEGAGQVGGEFPTTWYGAHDIYLALFGSWSTSVSSVRYSVPLSISPNPTTDKLYIKINDNEKVSVRVTDVMGREVYVNKEQSGAIDVRHWAKGVYHVLVNSKGERYASSVVVQ